MSVITISNDCRQCFPRHFIQQYHFSRSTHFISYKSTEGKLILRSLHQYSSIFVTRVCPSFFVVVANIYTIVYTSLHCHSQIDSDIILQFYSYKHFIVSINVSYHTSNFNCYNNYIPTNSVYRLPPQFLYILRFGITICVDVGGVLAITSSN